MAPVISPHTLSAIQAAQAIRNGELSSEQLVRDCLDHIALREDSLHAWTAIDAKTAIATARTLDREPARSLLHGIPIGVKDVIDAFGLNTEYNSPIYQGHRPRRDADVVARARAAGMIVIGKTVTTEFATRGRLGATRNPHNILYSPGGSSSGSAAAVADRMVPIAISTQTAGSIIRPASYCGVIGFKPTFGVIGTRGMKLLVPSFDTIGLHARTIADIALAFRILSGDTLSDLDENTKPKLTVAACRTPFWHMAEKATKFTLETTIERLSHAGVLIDEILLPDQFNELGAAHDTVSDYECWCALTPERLNHYALLSAGVRDKLSRGAAITSAQYECAKKTIDDCRQRCLGLFKGHDYILTASAPGIAPLFSENDTGNAIFNKLWTALELPCVNIPGPTPPNGLPVGIQIVAARNTDTDLLLAAETIRQLIEPESHSLPATQ